MRLPAILIFAIGCPEKEDPIVQPRIPVTEAPCDSPVALNVASGRTHTRVRLGAATEGVCGDNAEAFFRIELPLPANVSIAVSSDDDVAAAIFPLECPAREAITSCRAGIDINLDPGSHLIGVFGPTDSELDLTVEISAPEPPPPPAPIPGTCSQPHPIDLSRGRASISGDFTEAIDEQVSACSSDGARRAHV